MLKRSSLNNLVHFYWLFGQKLSFDPKKPKMRFSHFRNQRLIQPYLIGKKAKVGYVFMLLRPLILVDAINIQIIPAYCPYWDFYLFPIK